MNEIITKKCVRCGETKPISEFSKNGKVYYRPSCKMCHALEVREWNRANPDRVKEISKRKRSNQEEKKRIERQRRYYQNNLSAIKERAKIWYSKNRERAIKNVVRRQNENKDSKREYDKKRREFLKDELKEKRKTYYKNNRASCLERARIWRSENKDIVQAYHRKRKAQKSGGYVSPQEWNNVLEKYGRRCLKCGATENIELDHVMPLALGGKHSVDNIQPLCKKCNREKWKTFADYRPKE